ncbi:hypothetical protein Aperf_G00000038435 [Anoplocephala perfoliata]
MRPVEKISDEDHETTLASPPEDETHQPSPEHRSTVLGHEWADTRLTPTYHLNERGRVVLTVLLHDLASSRPQIVYAPHVWPLTAILLHYHRPKVVTQCIEAILDNAIDNRITHSAKLWRSRCLAIGELLKSDSLETLPWRMLNRSTMRAKKAKSGGDRTLAYQEESFRIDESQTWPVAIFHLPFECLVPMVDVFLTEGFKVLLRIGLVLWRLVMKDRQKGSEKSDDGSLSNTFADSVLIMEASKYPSDKARDLLIEAFKIRQLSRRLITSAIRAGSKSAEDPPGGVPLADHLVRPCVMPAPQTFKAYNELRSQFEARSLASTSRHSPSGLATASEIDFIRQNLHDQNLSVCMVPKVIYTSNVDGFSFLTLLDRCRAQERKTGRPDHILLVSTLSGDGLFGAFLATEWDSSHRGYYGSGTSFLFRLRPGPPVAYKYPSASDESRFQLCSPDEIAVGGGVDGGPPGLFLDSDMKLGRSGPSPTFGSQCLVTSPRDKIGIGHCGKGDRGGEYCYFKIGVVEVLGFENL